VIEQTACAQWRAFRRGAGSRWRTLPGEPRPEAITRIAERIRAAQARLEPTMETWVGVGRAHDGPAGFGAPLSEAGDAAWLAVPGRIPAGSCTWTASGWRSYCWRGREPTRFSPLPALLAPLHDANGELLETLSTYFDEKSSLTYPEKPNRLAPQHHIESDRSNSAPSLGGSGRSGNQACTSPRLPNDRAVKTAFAVRLDKHGKFLPSSLPGHEYQCSAPACWSATLLRGGVLRVTTRLRSKTNAASADSSGAITRTNESLNVRIVFDDCCIECRHLPHRSDRQGFRC